MSRERRSAGDQDAGSGESDASDVRAGVERRRPLAVPPWRLRDAGALDVAALVALINAAYVVEAEILRGERIDAAGVEDYQRRGTFLLAEDGGAERAALAGQNASPTPPAGCVFIEPRGASGYLGLLSVAPERQGGGLGAWLLEAAEARLRASGCVEVEILVLSARTELFPWYSKHGYSQFGDRPFTDVARQLRPFHYVEMRKTLLGS